MNLKKLPNESNFGNFVFFLIFLLHVNVGLCQNPLQLGTGGLVAGTPSSIASNPAAGWSDPSLRVFNGVAYLVVGRDANPDPVGFEMPYWSIFSSTDLRNWSLAIQIDPEDVNLPSTFKSCWAADLIRDPNNGNPFYFYFSRGGDGIGVAKLILNTTTKKFTLDATFNPRIIKQGAPGGEDHDPTLFYRDGIPYMLFGKDGFLANGTPTRYQIARLRNDGLALQDIATINGVDDIKPIVLGDNTPEEGFGGKTPPQNVARDHSYYHTYDGRDYISCSGAYLIANLANTDVNSPFGPYQGYKPSGSALYKTYGVGPNNKATPGHSSYSVYFGQTYHSWEYSFDRSVTRNFRQVHLTYLHYKNNGQMVDDVAFLNPADKSNFDPNNPDFGMYYSNGVGAYDANWPRIEAEWFFKKTTGVIKKEHIVKGFQVTSMVNDDFIAFPNVRNVPANAIVNFSFSSTISGGKIEVHTGGPAGPLWGVFNIPVTGSVNTYLNRSINTTIPAGVYDFYFVFKGTATNTDICHLDYIGFDNPANLVESAKTSTVNLSVPAEPLLTVYPNPATNMVNIHVSGLKSNNITIYNPAGKLVYSKKNVLGTVSISTVQLGGPGLYTIKTDTETKKLIIN